MLNIAQIDDCLGWEHCDDLNQARERFSLVTNLLNQVIILRQKAKQELLRACSEFPGEELHKLSWDNKLVRVSELLGSTEKSDAWQEADGAYRVLKLKQQEIYEDLLALKKIMEALPR